MNANQVETIVKDLNTVQPNGVLGGAIARRNPGAVALVNNIDQQRQQQANAQSLIDAYAQQLANLPFVGSDANAYLPEAEKHAPTTK